LRAILGITLAGAMLIPGSSVAQEGADTVPSLTVIRRAIEAFRDAPFSSGYVVLQAAFPHTVDTVVASRGGALEIIAAAPSGSLVYAGPLRHLVTSAIIVPCEHQRWTSEIVCPGGPGVDTTSLGAIPSIPLDSVESLEFLVNMRNGDVRRYPLHRGVDAIFLSPTAMSKFAWPYLARYGVEYAAMRRQQYLDAIR